MSRLLPNWLQAYLVYTNESVSPESYHLWVGISTIAGVLRRNVSISMGYFTYYPNMYIVLVSPPGRCKKSTAMRIARPLMQEVPGIKFSVDSTSREQLIKALAMSHQDGQSAMTGHQSEFASLLATSQMDMVVFLTDIYDCPPMWEHKSLSTTYPPIIAPFLNIIGGTTPDWIARAMPLDTIGIGLTSRIIFVYSDTPRRRKFFPKLTKEQEALVPLLRDDLTAISAMNGQFKIEPETEDWFDTWAVDEMEKSRTADSRLSGYYDRKPSHALKVAMCLSAAQRSDMVLGREDIESAIHLLDSIEEGMPRVFAAVGKNPLAPDIEAIYTTIITHREGIPFTVLLDMFKHSVQKDELEQVLETLRLIGRVELVQTESGPIYRPVMK